jgi:glycosyltransferase involved in cell wall biosynthesis
VLPGFAPPGDGSAAESVRAVRNRLSLWDGPFVLVPAPPSEETARGILDAFAQAAGGRDEVDLVVLDHPRRRLESLANARGVGLRVHFVGPAPREAECAWLSTSALSLVPGDAPLSGGLLLRALGLGSAPVAVGAAAAGIADWFESLGCGWARPGDAEGVAEAIERALDRDATVQGARERGREAAKRRDVPSLAARLGPALGAGGRAAKAA